ncbi:hypothetical protein [Planktothrix phage Pag-JY44]|nr:glycosyltransferase [Aphanizomenon phage Yong-DA]
MNSIMKVVLVGSFAPSLVNFRGPLLRDLVAAGHEVWGMAPENDPEVVAQLAEMGVKYKPIPFVRVSINPMDDWKGAKALAKELAEMKADAVLCYTLKIAIWGTMAAFWAGVPRRTALITGFGTAFLTAGLKGRLLKTVAEGLLRWSMKKATAVIVQNPDDQQALVDMGVKGPIQVVNGSGIDLSTFEEKPLPSGPTRFLMIGRILVEKGVMEYAQAAEIVKKKHPEVHFDLLGYYEERSNAITQTEIDRWKSEGILDWHGQQPDVKPYIAACHVYVLPSYREGTPRSVLEALAVGRPIITTDTNGCRSTIDHGVHGLLVPVKDSAALAEAMLKMIETPGLIEKMAAVARPRALDKYEVGKVNQDMMRIMGVQTSERS